MLQALRSAIANLSYDPDTDPAKIPAKLNLQGVGTIDYLCYAKGRNGKTMRVFADDPKRTFYFARLNKPAQDPEAQISRAAATFLSVWFIGQGMLIGACLAVGAWPVALGLGALTLCCVCALAGNPFGKKADADGQTSSMTRIKDLRENTSDYDSLCEA